MEIIKFPFGKADKQTLVAAAATPVTIINARTFIDLGTMGQDSTLNLTIAADLPVGSDLFIKAGSDGTARALISGTGMLGTNVAGTINKINYIHAIYDGNAFNVVGARLIN